MGRRKLVVMDKEHQIIMLPSEKPSQILFDTVGQELVYNPPVPQKMTVNVMPQHLYILSDEKIKEGDWFLRPNYSSGIKVGYIPTQADSSYFIGYGYDWTDCRKIIATTDTELHYNKVVEEDMHMYKESLPHIPQHIIEAYVKKPFDKVMVEYTLKESYELNENDLPGHVLVIDKPKLNQDGTLAVSLVEEKTIDMKALDICQRIVSFGDASPELMETSFIEIYNKANKWIKENL
jgi:hypothetical protein